MRYSLTASSILSFGMLISCVNADPQAQCVQSISEEIEELKAERSSVRSTLSKGYTTESRSGSLVGNYRCLQGASDHHIYIVGEVTAYITRSNTVFFEREIRGAVCDNPQFILDVIKNAFTDSSALDFSNISISRPRCSPPNGERLCHISGTIYINEQAAIDARKHQETLRFLDAEIPILERTAEQRKASCK